MRAQDVDDTDSHPRSPAVDGDLADHPTFARAYRRHAASTFRAAYAILGDPEQAGDVTQDVFARLWHRPGAYDPGRGDLAAYLRLRARSRAVDVWRERQASQRALVRLSCAEAGSRRAVATDETPDVAAEQHDDRAALLVAIRRLPPPQREAVVLAYWAGMTADEIAQRVSVPLGTAKSRIRLGVLRLGREWPAELAA